MNEADVDLWHEYQRKELLWKDSIKKLLLGS